MEGTGKVILTVQKRQEGPIQFRCITEDDTGKAGHDYTKMNEVISMKAVEKEREIAIGIVDDDEWEPDKDFIVKLCHNDHEMKQHDGEDTMTRVTIIDNDNPGTLGFSVRNMIVRPRDEICTLEIERAEGSSGLVSAEVIVTSNSEALGGRPAIRGLDW